MILQILIRAKPETIEMLQSILAPENARAFAQEELGAWVEFDIPGPEAISRVVEDLRDSVDLAAGAMSLWADCRERPRVTNLYYRDPTTGKQHGILLNACSIVAPLTPERLVEAGSGGLPHGAAVVDMAQQDAAVARALSVSASGATEWWELYILLEILKDALAKRKHRKSGSWDALLKLLSTRYGEPVKRLQDLRQTINYHRHFHSELPARPWEHGEAAQFIRTAVRDWIDGLLAPEDH